MPLEVGVRVLIGMVPPRRVHDFGEAVQCGAISAESYGAATRSIFSAYNLEDRSFDQYTEASTNITPHSCLPSAKRQRSASWLLLNGGTQTRGLLS